ncbi:MAG: flagellar type III secretion system pore protein FliP [Parvularcula sp.]
MMGRRFLITAITVGALLYAQGMAQSVDAVADIAQLDGTSLRQRIVSLFAAITVLSIAPGIVMMMSCFPFMAIVFSFVRQAIGLQHAPPAMMLTSLALFLTFFVMQPVVSDAWTLGIQPYLDGDMSEAETLTAISEPVRAFMDGRTAPGTVERLADAAGIGLAENDDPPLSLLIPSFMLSEITRAFQIGFAIFLPFLVIDLVVASVLMAMGMMMVPPAVVSLPFKLAFFVVADGWVKLTEALLRGYIQ